jgi:hypothetical protein
VTGKDGEFSTKVTTGLSSTRGLDAYKSPAGKSRMIILQTKLLLVRGARSFPIPNARIQTVDRILEVKYLLGW